MSTHRYDIILFYKYTTIENPEKLAEWHKDFCKAHSLKGRVIIAREGINATLEGNPIDIDAYSAEFTKDPRFKDVHIKRSEGNGKAFPRMSVKLRKEIVSLHLKNEDVDPNQITGKHLKPEELYHWIHGGKKDFHIIDMRNDFEQKVGYFAGSVLPGMKRFRDLPKVLHKLFPLKEKTVVTVCTGGVRCEKASGYLLKKGFRDVYQLEGGIVSYMEKFKNDDFKGKLYVFDDRITMSFTPDEKRTKVGKCDQCLADTERYVNCSYPPCHVHFMACDSCVKNGEIYCGLRCRILNVLARFFPALLKKKITS
jgi:UPF0176 protein